MLRVGRDAVDRRIGKPGQRHGARIDGLAARRSIPSAIGIGQRLASARSDRLGRRLDAAPIERDAKAIAGLRSTSAGFQNRFTYRAGPNRASGGAARTHRVERANDRQDMPPSSWPSAGSDKVGEGDRKSRAGRSPRRTAAPPRKSGSASSRARSSAHALPLQPIVGQSDHLRRLHRQRRAHRGGQFLDLVIAPARADRTGAGAPGRSPCPSRCRRRRWCCAGFGARLGHRRQRHRRVRLGRIPVGGLQRDEAAGRGHGFPGNAEARDRSCRSRRRAASHRPPGDRAGRRSHRTMALRPVPRRASRRMLPCRCGSAPHGRPPAPAPPSPPSG